MKNLVFGLLISTFLLTACVGNTLQTQTVPASPPNDVTSTPSSTPTQTFLPSATPTSSVTPLPAIPTFTPTFDVSTIVTVTPAPQAECPKEDPNLLPSFPIQTNKNYFIENSLEILQYLNEGGTLKKAAERLEITAPSYGLPIIEDVTGDKIPELVFVDFAVEPKLHVFSCVNGQYRDLLPDISDNLTGYSTAILAITNDPNQNSISDIVLLTSCNRGLGCTSFVCF